MMSKAGLTYNYSDTLHKHAVTGLSDGSSCQYDANGNMRLRVEGGVCYQPHYLSAIEAMQAKTNGGTR